MVDLVKIRKKAKERLEEKPVSVVESQKEVSNVGSRKSGEPVGETKSAAAEPPSETPKPADVSLERRRGSKKPSAPADQQAGKAKVAAGSGMQAAPPPSEISEAPTAESRQPKAENRQPVPDSRQPTPDTPSAKSTKLDRFKEQAGRRRENAGSAGRAATESIAVDERLEVLTFAIAGENYAIDIERIVEIVPPRTATRVPNANESIVGIMSLRGTIVTLLDVRGRLKHAPAEPTPETRIIVLEHQGETIGFEVDRVFRVVKIGASEVDPHPVVHASEQDESIRGVFRQGESLTILLDFAILLGVRESQRPGPREALAAGR